MNLKRVSIFCIALLWFAAMHHCAFEQVLSSVFNAQPVQETTDAGNLPLSSETECPEHAKGDPASHSEGQSCGSVMQANLNTKLHNTDHAVLSVSFGSIAYLKYDFLASPNSFQTFSNFVRDEPQVTSCLVHSLSIVPNAPPVTLL